MRACTVLTTVVLALALLAPPPAGAAARSRSGIDVYYVQVGSGLRAWPVKFGVRYVDRYTGSALRVARCPSPRPRHVGCIRVVSKRLPGHEAGRTSWTRDGRATVRLDPQFRGRSRLFKRVIVAHELAHAHALRHNTHTCHSLMYPSTRCLRGKHFTAPEARFLAAR